MVTVSDNVLTQLCKQQNICKDQLQFLGGGRVDSDGIAYTFVDNGKQKVLKILAFEKDRQRDLEAFEQRVQFAHFLGEHDVPIAYPQTNDACGLYCSYLEDKYIFLAYVMEFCEGKSPETSMLVTGLAQDWGRLIGRIHKSTKQYAIWKNLTCNNFEFGYQDEIDFFENWCKEDKVKAAWRQMRTTMDGLPKNRGSYGLIHNDNHQKNIIVKDKDITLIDIDCMTGQFFLQDITVPAQGIMFDLCGGMHRPLDSIEPLKKYFDSFINGYEQENHLDEMWLKQINIFIDYRRLLLFTVMQDYLNTNVSLKESFIAMINEPPKISVF
jgi:Ser/Thr protein kinase RdoA (MazF antagonist)